MYSRILAINGGSSSIKFALFDDSLKQIFTGEIGRIGLPNATFHLNGVAQPIFAPNHTAAVAILIDWIEKHTDGLTAVGHRIVHGGPNYSKPVKITPAIIKDLHEFSSFDPQHIVKELQIIEAIRDRFPKLTQVACFDTAFHHDLPLVAKLLPIPRCYEAQGIRRYGFHGLSYEFLMSKLSESQGRVILAHLGNGASLTAVLAGKSIDTSMSFTPTAGVPMSTRSGDLDPGLALHLGLNPKEFNEMVNFKSGLLGVSEISSDMSDLLASKDPKAAEAIALFSYQVKKFIGGYAAALGGLDTLVFSGGIGENASAVRTQICKGLEFLGIELDEKKNESNDALISKGRVNVRVIRTNEEWMIAKTVWSLKL